MAEEVQVRETPAAVDGFGLEGDPKPRSIGGL